MTGLTFAVRAPASSANLGPGYDCAAAALDLWNELYVTPGTGTLIVEGDGASDPELTHNNVVQQTFRRIAGSTADTVDLRCVNRVPIARGLGSSTAAAALGFIAGWHVTGSVWNADRLFDELTRHDGHPDNAAAVAYGGVVWCGPESSAHQLSTGEQLACVCIVPDRRLSTAASREAVPEHVPTRVATAQASAAGMLAAGLVTGNRDLLRAGLHGDHLHETARGTLVPELDVIRSQMSERDDVLGVTLSGAGSTIAVWTSPEAASTITTALQAVWRDGYQVISCATTPTGSGVFLPS